MLNAILNEKTKNQEDDILDAFDQMNWPVWINLNDDEKKLLFRQALMYFVSPLKLVKDVTLKDFSYYGIKSRTFELTIDGEPFVFVPGQKDAILGWEKGLESVNTREVIAGDLAFQFFAKKEHPVFPTPEELSAYVNNHTSPLRKAEVPPMFVAKFPVSYGMIFQGTLHATTGNFKGNLTQYNEVKGKILPHLFPKLTPEESLTYEFPLVLKDEDYYCILDIETNQYYLYRPFSNDFAKIKKELRRYNFDFSTEDEYEFFMTAGSRRLFFYSNDHGFFNEAFFENKQLTPNMFGIPVGINLPKILCQNRVIKGGPKREDRSNILEALLPFSGYYREELTDEKVEDLSYYKVIRIKP